MVPVRYRMHLAKQLDLLIRGCKFQSLAAASPRLALGGFKRFSSRDIELEVRSPVFKLVQEVQVQLYSMPYALWWRVRLTLLRLVTVTFFV